MRLELRPIDPVAPIEAALQTVRPDAHAKRIRLETRLDRAAGPILGDAGRLQQVVSNLLSNAVKFTPPDGRVEVWVERGHADVIIRVSDTGQGISAELLPHVCDRFRQADGVGSRPYQGIGLGLTIVRYVVELHGGTVSVSSAGEGKGSVFTVVLPRPTISVDAGSSAEEGEGSPEDSRSARLRIVPAARRGQRPRFARRRRLRPDPESEGVAARPWRPRARHREAAPSRTSTTHIIRHVTRVRIGKTRA